MGELRSVLDYGGKQTLVHFEITPNVWSLNTPYDRILGKCIVDNNHSGAKRLKKNQQVRNLNVLAAYADFFKSESFQVEFLEFRGCKFTPKGIDGTWELWDLIQITV